MQVSLGNLINENTGEIPHEDISVVFFQAPDRSRVELHIYFLNRKRKPGRIVLSPYEFRKIMKTGFDYLAENKVPE